MSNSVDFVKQEVNTLKFWKKNKIFEKSLKQRDVENKWTFLDGPPFITGLPHYGSLLSSIAKDLFPRYKTMRGYHVRRVWGWDCHGLPAENKVEEKLGIKDKREIEEKLGVDKFIEQCRLYVSETSEEWDWYVGRIGRWVDLKNAYRTMDKDYMESVMWVFKQMYDKGFIYKGLRVSLYCPHCQTPISNFEVAMDQENYKDLTEPATTYKYKLEGENTYILAWSTTPWNKIATPALAVNPKLTYVRVKQGEEEYILAKSALRSLKEAPKYKVIDEFKGSRLVDRKFEPHYDYYRKNAAKGENMFVIIPAEFVSAEEGTGVVTIAAYGVDDMEAMRKHNIYMEMHVENNGHIKEDVPLFGGMYYLRANEKVDEDLAERGLIYQRTPHTHNIPHCWRCQTRLFHNPQDAWYVQVQKLKNKMKKNNENVNWFPGHFKHGRFLKSMEAAPDWNISRSRYWGSPVPVWECECGERFVPGSIEELEKASGRKVKDLHKPEIDGVVVTCQKCGKEAGRVPEVLDSWIEAGSASFAERHFPFEKGMDSRDASDFFPADFVSEYTGQIRAWFYVLHVIGSALYDVEAFRNVVVTGVVLGTDGRKMSKNFGNYPDPKRMIETYGGDALRLYLMGSPVMRGGDLLISEDDYRDSVKGFLLPLWNVYNYFSTYSKLDNWNRGKEGVSSDALDRWIASRLNNYLLKVTNDGYEKLDTPQIVTLAREFLVNDLSLWYLRRSRDRFGSSSEDLVDKQNGYSTFYEVLTKFCESIAPVAPFISEEIYRKLTGNESVHLADWPEANAELIDEKLEQEMEMARRIVERAHAVRKEAEIKLRQPLAELKIVSQIDLSPQVQKIIADEVNVLRVKQKKGKNLEVEIDTKISPELSEMGLAREIIRSIQSKRKELGTRMDELVEVTLPSWPKAHEEEIRRKALVYKLNRGEFRVERKGK